MPTRYTSAKTIAMPSISFTPNLRRHLEASCQQVPGQTVREVLEAVFSKNPRLRGYILDDQGALRQHVVVFLDGDRIDGCDDLSAPVLESSELYVMQALSGG